MQCRYGATLVTQIIAHVRKRFFGKKFTLCDLKLDLCILIKLVGKKNPKNPGWDDEKCYQIWNYKVFCEVETKLESRSQMNKHMFKLTQILF